MMKVVRLGYHNVCPSLLKSLLVLNIEVLDTLFASVFARHLSFQEKLPLVLIKQQDQKYPQVSITQFFPI